MIFTTIKERVVWLGANRRWKPFSPPVWSTPKKTWNDQKSRSGGPPFLFFQKFPNHEFMPSLARMFRWWLFFFFYHFFWASRIARNLEWQTICFTCFLLITLRDCRLVPSTFSDTSGPQMVPTYWWKTQGLAALICSGPNVQPSFYHGKSPFFKTIRRIFLIFSKSPMVFGAWSRCQIPAAMRLPFVAFGPPWPSVWAWRVPPATATAWRCCGGRPGPKATSARWPWRSASWRIAWWRFIVIGMEIWGKWRLDLFICYRYLWNMNCNWFCNLN